MMKTSPRKLASRLRFDPLRIIYWTTIGVLVVFGISAGAHHTTYVVDATLFVMLATIIFLFKRSIIFSWQGALLCCVGMLMNTAGTFGAYNLSLLGIGWDKLLHLVTTIGIGLLAYAYLGHASQNRQRPVFNRTELAALTIIIVVGLGAFNEMSEFVGTRYFGFNHGILGMANGSRSLASDLERFDTQWDLLTNALGGAIAVASLTIASLFAKKPSSVKRKPSVKRRGFSG